MLLLELDDTGRKPMYQQIIDQVRNKIDNQSLKPGDKLPSTRKLAEKLGIHRSTVATAYQELWALGFLDLKPGLCPEVRARKKIATPACRTKEGLIDWSSAASAASNTILKDYCVFNSNAVPAAAAMISFSSLDMDQRLFPLENFRSSLSKAFKIYNTNLLGYSNVKGFPPLCEYIARRLQNHGISVTADEILITSGSQQGLDLVFRMIAAPGRTVAVEAPTYGHILPLLRFYGLTPLSIPITNDGLDLTTLEATLRNQKPSLLYTMPTFQNPTGISTSQYHREQVLSLCETYRVPILEDGFEEEMKYFGRTILPIKSMDKNNLVIYCGTFSKILFPGARVGWIAADKNCIDRLTAIRCFSELSPNIVLQAAIHEFCEAGYYDRHISKMHRIYRKRMQTALTALRQNISSSWADWDEPSGGFIIWLRLKNPDNQSINWQEILLKHQVNAVIGDIFFSESIPAPYLRLSISALDENEIIEGIQRLARALCSVFGQD